MLQEPSLEWMIHTFQRIYHGCIRSMIEEQGMQEASNPAILFLLEHHGESPPITQREIADRLGVATSTVAVSVKRMERAGLIRKEADTADLRRNYITITDKGRELTRACFEVEQTVSRRMVQGFTQEEQNTLRDFFRRMIANLQGLHHDSCPRHNTRKGEDSHA